MTPFHVFCHSSVLCYGLAGLLLSKPYLSARKTSHSLSRAFIGAINNSARACYRFSGFLWKVASSWFFCSPVCNQRNTRQLVFFYFFFSFFWGGGNGVDNTSKQALHTRTCSNFYDCSGSGFFFSENRVLDEIQAACLRLENNLNASDDRVFKLFLRVTRRMNYCNGYICNLDFVHTSNLWD